MNLSKLRSLLSEDHCKKPDSLDCKVERIAKKYAKKEAEKENDEHEKELHETAPPGREDQVKALKKKFSKKSAYKIAWASYNKSKLAEGSIKDLVTKDEEEKRLMNQKVMSDGERKKLKALKKLVKAKK